MKNLRFRVGLIGLLFAGLITAIYFQTFYAGFLPWDDDYNITLNFYYKLHSWTDLWSRVYYGMYIPVTSSVWAGLYSGFQGKAEPFRVLNLFLHITNVVLLYLILKWWMEKLKIQSWWLGLGGLALFAFHPLQVETVAWISGARDMLSTTFGFLALLCYFKIRNWKGFALGGLFFIFSLLSKPQLASLPLVIFILQIILDRNRWKKTAAQMSVWVLPVFAIVTLTFQEQKEVMLKTVEIWQRPVVMLDSFGFYWMKLFAPFHLAVDYGRTPYFLFKNFSSQCLPISLFLVLLLIFSSAFLMKKKAAAPLFFLAWVASLLPVSGLVDFAYQEISTTTDHYVYFSLAILALLSLPLLAPLQHKKMLLLFSFFFLSAFWSLLSWERVHIWLAPKVFFDEMLLSNPHSYSALIGLGGYESQQKDNEKALAYFKRALEERPQDIVARTNMASSLGFLGRYKEVAQMESLIFEPGFKKALDQRHLSSASFLTSLGAAAFFLNQVDAAILYFCQAQSINPYSPDIENNVAVAFKKYREQFPQAVCPRFSSTETFLDIASSVKLSARQL